MWRYEDIDDIERGDFEETMIGCVGELIGVVIGLIIAVIFCMCMGSCSPKVVTNTVTMHDTLRVVNLQHDSTWVHDSVYVDRWMKGDTCFLTKYVEHTMWRDRWKTDTIYKTRTDSISTVKVEKVEKDLNWWQRARLMMGNVFLGLLAVCCAYGCYKIYMRLGV